MEYRKGNNFVVVQSLVKWKLLSRLWLFATPWTIQSTEFSRAEYWSRLPFPSPGDLPNPGIELRSPALQADSLPAEPQGKPKNTGVDSVSLLQLIFPTQESTWGLPHPVTKSCATLCNPVDCSIPSFPVLHYLPEFTQTHVSWVTDAIQPSHPLPPFSFAFNLSSESALHIRWPKYWSFSLSISLSDEYSGLISFSVDWFDLLAVQGTLESLFQDHSLKASSFRCSTFFMVQLSHPYMTAGNTIALTIWTFVGKVMYLLFNKLCRSQRVGHD